MGKTSPSSQGCAPALAGQPKSPAVRWSRLCTPCLLPAFPSLLLPHRVILPAAAAALKSSQPHANSRLLLFSTQRCAPVQTAKGTEAPRAQQCLEMPSGRPGHRSHCSHPSHI